MRQVRVRARGGAMALAAVLSSLFAGCSPPPLLPGNLPTLPAEYLVPPDPYRIDVGDELDIEFFYQPEMSRKVVVRTDGRITLSGVGELVAGGRTPAELAGDITKSYSALFKDPLVTVNVARMASARVYVVGEVGRPGGYELSGRLTLATALSEAGGPAKYANLQAVKVIRRSGASPKAFKVDASSVRKGQWTGPEIVLAPNDIVVVPRGTLGHVADFMTVIFNPGLITLYTLIIVLARTS